MKLSGYEEVERSVIDQFPDLIDEDSNPHVRGVWEFRVLPQLRERAKADGVAAEGYGALLGYSQIVLCRFHESTHFYGTFDSDRPKKAKFWAHQSINLFKADDHSRGYCIDRASLSQVAADYISRPEIQNSATDWYLMDALVFAELDAFAYHLMSGGGLRINWAWLLAEYKGLKYAGFAAFFVILGFALRYVAPPALAIYLAGKGYDGVSISIFVIWCLYLIYLVIVFPARWRLRTKQKQLMQLLVDCYAQLSGSVISPARFRDAIDRAAKAGVVFDGALFAIADRVAKRDETAFMPFQYERAPVY